MFYRKFHISDWLVETSHLTIEEEAIYLRLSNYYFLNGPPIPTDLKLITRKLRLCNYTITLNSVLNEFFIEGAKGWFHKEFDKALKKYKKDAIKNKKNGAKGGRPRKDAASSQTQPKPIGLPVATESQPKHNPNQEPLTINQEPLNNIKDFASLGMRPNKINDGDAHTQTEMDLPRESKKPVNKKPVSENDKLFERFWWSGTRNGSKKKAKSIFMRLVKSESDPAQFTDMIINDTLQRSASNQFGFSRQYISTYLSNECWNDRMQNDPNSTPQQSERITPQQNLTDKSWHVGPLADDPEKQITADPQDIEHKP